MFLTRRCVVCGVAGDPVCPRCEEQLTLAPPEVQALYVYEEVGRDLVLALKRNRGRAAVPWLAERLAARAQPVEVVTWPPTTDGRRRNRGYDQAELLARAVGRQLRVPARALLRRISAQPQHGRARADRLLGPAFAARGIVPPRVLLVDDVTTTGATLRAAEHCLRRAGAVFVQTVSVAAAFPDHGLG